MTTDFKAPFLVQSIYSFKGKNNDELCFRKGDIITVTQTEEGGWWEGSLDGKTGWFPSNYVKPYQKDGRSTTSDASQNKCGTLIMDLLMQCKANRVVIVKDLIDSEKAHVTELNNLFNNFLLPIQRSELLKKEEYQQLIGNIEQIVEEHEKLLKGLEEVALQPTEQQRIGRLFLSSAAWFKQIHKAYCASHPRAVLIIDKYKEELGNIMELNGASSPGVLVLTIGLSKPFRRLDKYSGMLQELERYTDECHVDRGDLQRSISVYKDIMSVCAVTRRQKELELEVLRGGVRGWEGDDLSSLGEIVHMGSVAVGPDHTDRYFVLFPTTLLILSISHRMSAFIYEGKLPLTGIHVNNLEDTSNETYRNAFEIVGPMIEKIIAICQTKEDKLMWLEKIRHQISTIRSSSVSFGGGGGGQSPLKCVSPQTSTSSSYHFPSKSSVTTTTTAAPPPTPPHAVSHSSIPYINLTRYFSILVRNKVITRTLLKKLLYKEYIINYKDVDKVKRRKIHKSEYVIFKENKLTTIDDNAVESSSFTFLASPVYRSTLIFGSSDNENKSNITNMVCEDLSKLDDHLDNKLISSLPNDASTIDSRISEPSFKRNYTLHSAIELPFKSFSVNIGKDRRICTSIDNIKLNNDEDDVEEEGEERDRCESYVSEYKMFSNNNDEDHFKLSLRSSDSGLSDITSPDINTVSTGAIVTTTESDGSSNFETQCICTSPFDTCQVDDGNFVSEHKTDLNGLLSNDDNKTGNNKLVFRSEMYAHWWMKAKIPKAALKTHGSFDYSETGKANIIIVHNYYYYEYYTWLILTHLLLICRLLAEVDNLQCYCSSGDCCSENF